MKIWQVDAFAEEAFKGNPAAVVLLDRPLSDAVMQSIAEEMALSETAFVLPSREGLPHLRWFTPVKEVDLCGHATLAAAHAYLTSCRTDLGAVTFSTQVAGALTVEKTPSGYRMDFPARPGRKIPVEDVPEFVLAALGSARPVEAFQARDLMLVYENEQAVRGLAPDFPALKAHKDWIITTASSDAPEYDFVSRFFCADDGINEDPVTGSAHCTLGPYWAHRLGKDRLVAWQASRRGGKLWVEMAGDRVFISGPAITVLEGNIHIDSVERR